MSLGRAELLNVTNPDVTAPTLIIPTTWTPASILTDVLWWYKADVGVTSSSGLVSAVAEQSGNGVPLSQGTGANQYQVVSAAQNGLPMLAQQASSSQYNMSGSYQASNARHKTDPWTILAAIRFTGQSNGALAVGAGITRESNLAGWWAGCAGNNAFMMATAASTTTGKQSKGSTVPVTNSNYCLAFVDTGATGTTTDQQIYVNGAAETMTTMINNFGSGDITLPDTLQNVRISSVDSTGFQASWAFFEWFAVRRALTTIELRNATAYLRQRWNF
jgi:hypothetical protein